MQSKLLPLLLSLCLPALAQTYSITSTIPLGGTGAWDYLLADSDTRRLYVSHSSEVDVLDLDTHQVVGKLAGFGFIHGIVIVPSLHTGFLSDGQKNEVVTFDPATLEIKSHIKTVANPNSMAFDEDTGRLFVAHKPSKSTTVIEAASGKIIGSVPLGGIPEFPVTDGPNLFVNLEDKNEVVKIDTKTLAIRAHFSLAPCTAPAGLAVDKQHHVLFSACDNKIFTVLSAETGAILAILPSGPGPDAAAFDPTTHLAFSSNGDDGTLTIASQHDANHYRIAQTLKTQEGARTMALDRKTHTLFLSTAKLGPPPAPTPANPHPPNHPVALPGTFGLLVISPTP